MILWIILLKKLIKYNYKIKISTIPRKFFLLIMKIKEIQQENLLKDFWEILKKSKNKKEK